MSPRLLMVLKCVLFFFFVFLFSYKTFTFIDPDLGWHLRAGEIVVQTHTAPMVDNWSYLLPSHAWIDHEWLLDGLIWQAFTKGGILALEVIFVLFAALPLCVWLLRARTMLSVFFISFFGYSLLSVIGLRPQVLSFFLFFVFFEIYRAINRANLYLLFPFYFFVWANMHAGFAAGLLLWGLILLAKYAENWRAYREFFVRHATEIAAMALSFLATFFTPYGADLIREIWESTSIPDIARISEWSPAFAHWQIPLIFTVGLGGALLAHTLSRKDMRESIPAGVFFALFLQHVRMAPMFYTTLAPLIEHAATRFYAKIGKGREYIVGRFEMCMVVGIVLMLAMLWNTAYLTAPIAPPTHAILALASPQFTKISGRLFNEYGFGGWLIYHYPHEQFFIDGRMPHWKDEAGKAALTTYIEVMESDHWRQVFAQFSIEKAILAVSSLPSTEAKEQKPQLQSQFFADLIERISPTPPTGLATKLLEAGWCVRYRDEAAAILVAPKYCRGEN